MITGRIARPDSAGPGDRPGGVVVLEPSIVATTSGGSLQDELPD
jgi:hypothetical protein